MNNLNIEDTPLKDLKIITRRNISDDRGFLSRIFCSEELHQAGWHKSIKQINHTYTNNKGTIRGMHFQRSPDCEMKLVNCLKGEVYDVAVDLRIESDTFLQHYAIKLDETLNRSLLIPEGFAHGFQALTDKVELLYLHSHQYSQSSEDGLNPIDPKLDIPWPIKDHQISDKDKSRQLIINNFKGT